MKSEWEFQFETRGFRFEREHKYKATVDNPIKLGDQPAEYIEFLVRIVPKENEPPPYVEQLGSLFITLPYSQTETRDFAHYAARMIADLITFQQGAFRIRYGLITCKRIAETPEEEAKFGDKLYGAEIRLQEVVPPPAFDAGSLTKTPTISQHAELISQFNETKRDTSVIRQFLGYFRILESIYYTADGRKPLKQVLTESADLRQIHGSLVKGGSYEAFISALVEIRHKCAHLKLGKGFGYVPIDPAIEYEIKPNLPLLAAMAYRSILGPEQMKE